MLSSGLLSLSNLARLLDLFKGNSVSYVRICSALTSNILTASLSLLSGRKLDRSQILATQIASKGYFSGEAAGVRLAGQSGMIRALSLCGR